MILIKLLCHIHAAFQLVFYRLVYGQKLSFGKGSTFRRGFSLMIGKNGRVSVGRNCFFNNGCSLNCLNAISIGEGSIFGENVKIYDHNHRFSDFTKTIKEQGYSVGEVSIGAHCWIGSNVTILKGTSIGERCVIGAGCVISGAVEPGTLVKQGENLVMEPVRNA